MWQRVKEPADSGLKPEKLCVGMALHHGVIGEDVCKSPPGYQKNFKQIISLHARTLFLKVVCPNDTDAFGCAVRCLLLGSAGS